MKTSKTIYENVAAFLLKCPLDEIGNEQVIDIVQSYQNQMIHSRDAIELIINEHRRFLDKFIQMTMYHYVLIKED